MRASCLCLLACFAVLGWGVVSDGNASSHDVWRAWLAAEKHATQFARTRAELDAYEVACEQHAPALVALAQRHKALDRVLVVDARFQWDGLGDNLDRYAAMLRCEHKRCSTPLA